MKSCFIVAAVVSLVIIIGGCAGSDTAKEPARVSEDIRLNSLGYLPAAQKRATIISRCSNFTINEFSKGNTVYSGKVTGPISQADVNPRPRDRRY